RLSMFRQSSKSPAQAENAAPIASITSAVATTVRLNIWPLPVFRRSFGAVVRLPYARVWRCAKPGPDGKLDNIMAALADPAGASTAPSNLKLNLPVSVGDGYGPAVIERKATWCRSGGEQATR